MAADNPDVSPGPSGAARNPRRRNLPPGTRSRCRVLKRVSGTGRWPAPPPRPTPQARKVPGACPCPCPGIRNPVPSAQHHGHVRLPPWPGSG